MTGIRSYRDSVLKGEKRFSRLFTEGRRFQGNGAALQVLQTDNREPSQVVICVPKRVGNAVARNRLKRIAKESLNELIPALKEGCFIAFVLNRKFKNYGPGQRVEIMRLMLKRAALVSPKQGL